MVLTAYAMKKNINARLNLPVEGDCKSIENYQEPLYISMSD